MSFHKAFWPSGLEEDWPKRHSSRKARGRPCSSWTPRGLKDALCFQERLLTLGFVRMVRARSLQCPASSLDTASHCSQMPGVRGKLVPLQGHDLRTRAEKPARELLLKVLLWSVRSARPQEMLEEPDLGTALRRPTLHWLVFVSDDRCGHAWV